MGMLITGKCSCGYETDSLAFGIGMKRVIAPAICLKCMKLCEADYCLKNIIKCRKCGSSLVFYNNSLLQDDRDTKKGSAPVADSFDILFNESIWKWALEEWGIILSDDQSDSEYRKFEHEASIRKKFVLYDVNYLCPKCTEMKMRFVKTFGFWD